MSKETSDKQKEQQSSTSSTSYEWISVQDRFPSNWQVVLCKYEGVYDGRFVTFWRDPQGTPHFGLPNERDGKGSQPATHWMPFTK